METSAETDDIGTVQGREGEDVTEGGKSAQTEHIQCVCPATRGGYHVGVKHGGGDDGFYAGTRHAGDANAGGTEEKERMHLFLS